jgi:hypothetical protein
VNAREHLHARNRTPSPSHTLLVLQTAVDGAGNSASLFTWQFEVVINVIPTGASESDDGAATNPWIGVGVSR